MYYVEFRWKYDYPNATFSDWLHYAVCNLRENADKMLQSANTMINRARVQDGKIIETRLREDNGQ